MTNGEHQVLVIGAAGLDMKIQGRAVAIEPGQSNPATIRCGWGGVARNIAENLARLGADVQLITAVGDDAWGEQLLAQLRQLGIGIEGALVLPGRDTGAYAGIYHLSERLWTAFDDMQIIREITPSHLNQYRRLFRDADMVCIDANLSARALETVFRLAESYEIPVCADPTTPMLASRLHPFLNQLALLTPDRREAEALLGEPLNNADAILQGARKLAHAGVDLAIITQGAEGLSYATSKESGRLPAFQSSVIDPVGAGDALTAAVAYGLLEDLPASEAVRLGLAAAAQTIICKETVCPSLNLETLYEQLIV